MEILETIHSNLLSKNNIQIICSKPYGWELLFMLYKNTKHNQEYGIDKIFENIKYNRCTKPSFINFINYLETANIICRSESVLKKSKVLLKLTDPIVIELQQSIDDCRIMGRRPVANTYPNNLREN
tara:strand:- start:588 stop:965 length:378 start_codon:yes stop_codon:yes gene_type:complete